MILEGLHIRNMQPTLNSIYIYIYPLMQKNADIFIQAQTHIRTDIYICI